MTFTKKTAAIAVLSMTLLLPAVAQQQPAKKPFPASVSSGDAQIQLVQTAQQNPSPITPSSPAEPNTESLLIRAQKELKVLELQEQIDKLKAQQQALLKPAEPPKPPAPVVASPAVPTPCTPAVPSKRPSPRLPPYLQKQLDRAAKIANEKAGLDLDSKTSAQAPKDAQTARPCPAPSTAAQPLAQ